ncbi:MAG: glycine--tRNA ligase subunit beta [Thermoleophilia bacterium]
MTATRDFLFEIGVEELPAAAAKDAVGQAHAAAVKAFSSRNLACEPGQVSVWVSPRRIAVFIAGLPEQQADIEAHDRGPAVRAAFDDAGQPTRAAIGFARAKGIEVEQLEVREHKGQDFVFAVHKEQGGPAVAAIPEACREILASFSFPRTMRWDATGMRFSRPVRWLVTKFGADTIEFEAGALRSSDVTRGHRFLAEKEFVVESASSYLDQLRLAKVVVDQEERRAIIRQGLDDEAGKLGAEYFDPAAELEEVLYLVENPSVQKGGFREAHLRLPEAVLVTAMQSHQRYFPLRGGDGSLVASFLQVINGDPAHIGEINEGNERVLEGRLEDAEFSYDKDLATGIEAMRGALDNVVFHKRLGTMADKSRRLQGLVETLCGQLCLEGKEKDAAASAAALAKADLVSIMVQEFPTLEGYMGAAYAAIDAYPANVCAAISEHYLPRFSGGELPATLPGAVLSICDKVDNLVGAFAVNELPTGSRDPYGLRRAAAGIYEIVRDRGLEFGLGELLGASYGLFVEQEADLGRGREDVVDAVVEFVNDRIQQRMVESGLPVGVVEAARAARLPSIRRLTLLTDALEAFRGTPEFEDFHTAYFRSSKIAAKAGEESGEGAVDTALFEDEAEGLLNDAADRLRLRIDALLADDDFAGALKEAATIRGAVDRYFDDVLIMADDDRLRRNRLSLVSKTAAVLQGLGDPMLVAAAPKKAGGR